jgi:hypothetical protein
MSAKAIEAEANRVAAGEYDSDDSDSDGMGRKHRRLRGSGGVTTPRFGPDDGGEPSACPHCQRPARSREERFGMHWRKFGYHGPAYCRRCAVQFHAHMKCLVQEGTCSVVSRCERCKPILVYFRADPSGIMRGIPSEAQAALDSTPAASNRPPPRPKAHRAFRSGSGPPIIKQENLRILFTYMAERQRVFHRWLDNAPTPWTSDAVLLRGRMCNNFRFLDRESAWLVANVIEPLRDQPADLLFNVLLFRTYLNWVSSCLSVPRWDLGHPAHPGAVHD